MKIDTTKEVVLFFEKLIAVLFFKETGDSVTTWFVVDVRSQQLDSYLVVSVESFSRLKT